VIADICLVDRFAYVEFAEPEHIDAALALDNSLFHGRLIKVRAKDHAVFMSSCHD
jgi:RNA recognition motif-containing protein